MSELTSLDEINETPSGKTIILEPGTFKTVVDPRACKHHYRIDESDQTDHYVAYICNECHTGYLQKK